MADTLYGYSFTPDLANRFRSALNGGPTQISPQAGQALQTISLHLPSFLGSGATAPDALLRPRLGGFTPDTAVRAMTSGSSAPPPSALPPPAAAPPPGPDSPPLSVFTPSQ